MERLLAVTPADRGKWVERLLAVTPADRGKWVLRDRTAATPTRDDGIGPCASVPESERPCMVMVSWSHAYA